MVQWFWCRWYDMMLANPINNNMSCVPNPWNVVEINHSPEFFIKTRLLVWALINRYEIDGLYLTIIYMVLQSCSVHSPSKTTKTCLDRVCVCGRWVIDDPDTRTHAHGRFVQMEQDEGGIGQDKLECFGLKDQRTRGWRRHEKPRTSIYNIPDHSSQTSPSWGCAICPPPVLVNENGEDDRHIDSLMSCLHNHVHFLAMANNNSTDSLSPAFVAPVSFPLQSSSRSFVFISSS